MLNDNGVLNLKVVRDFFYLSSSPSDSGMLMSSNSIPHSKYLVLWKVLHDRLPSYKDIHKGKVILCCMCTLSRKNKEDICHLFFYCLSTIYFCTRL